MVIQAIGLGGSFWNNYHRRPRHRPSRVAVGSNPTYLVVNDCACGWSYIVHSRAVEMEGFTGVTRPRATRGEVRRVDGADREKEDSESPFADRNALREIPGQKAVPAEPKHEREDEGHDEERV
jgi:hypothetical protein